MKYLNEIERLGGIRPLYTTNKIMSLDEFILLEKKISNNIPLDYKDFILKNPVSVFNKFISFKAFDKYPVYRYPKESNFPDFIFNSSCIGVFFSKEDKDNVYDLNENINTYINRIPSDMLPIFTDGMGNLGLLCLQKEKHGNVYFWDHELEWDSDDYFEDTGKIMPEEAKFQNLWIIGTSFTDFLSRCYIDENETDC